MLFDDSIARVHYCVFTYYASLAHKVCSERVQSAVVAARLLVKSKRMLAESSNHTSISSYMSTFIL